MILPPKYLFFIVELVAKPPNILYVFHDCINHFLPQGANVRFDNAIYVKYDLIVPYIIVELLTAEYSSGMAR